MIDILLIVLCVAIFITMLVLISLFHTRDICEKTAFKLNMWFLILFLEFVVVIGITLHRMFSYVR